MVVLANEICKLKHVMQKLSVGTKMGNLIGRVEFDDSFWSTEIWFFALFVSFKWIFVKLNREENT